MKNRIGDLQKHYDKLLLPSFKYGTSIFMKPEFEVSSFLVDNILDSNYSYIEKFIHKDLVNNLVANKSDESCVFVMRISDAITKGLIDQNDIRYSSKFVNDKVYLYNYLKANDGIFIHVRADLDVTDNDYKSRGVEKKPAEISLKLVEKLGKYSKVVLLIDPGVNVVLDLDIDYKDLFSGIFNFIVRDNASLKVKMISDFVDSNTFVYVLTTIAENSIFEMNQINYNYKFLKMDMVTYLNSDFGKSTYFISSFNHSNNKGIIGASNIHNGKNSESDILFSSAINNESSLLFNGLVKVSVGATNNNGFQNGNVLLLDDGATANIVPKLEIDNDDVSCSHGATVSYLSSEKLFYLMSRGISEQSAKKMVTWAFVSRSIKNYTELDIPRIIKYQEFVYANI